jgi:hypothetical protein
MAWFADGSVCSYFKSIRLPPLVAVGWLESGHQYPIGDMPPEAFRRLTEYQLGAYTGWQPVLYLGSHGCDFCRDESVAMAKNLFVPGAGVTYVAPEGIVHYVRCHRYLPPEEFSAALIASPAVNSPQYFVRLRDNGWSDRVANSDLCRTKTPPNPRLHPTALAGVVAKFVDLMRRRR